MRQLSQLSREKGEKPNRKLRMASEKMCIRDRHNPDRYDREYEICIDAFKKDASHRHTLTSIAEVSLIPDVYKRQRND